jgi:hypothetical protein
LPKVFSSPLCRQTPPAGLSEASESQKIEMLPSAENDKDELLQPAIFFATAIKKAMPGL